jgi:hypothetical protein
MNIDKIINAGRLYVYDKQEVMPTGRTAIKKVKNMYVPGGVDITEILWEIEPIDPDVHWKIFVKPADLYEITQD